MVSDLAELFDRDLDRLRERIEAFPDDASLWQRHGAMNPPGNLVLHLEGNLREFIGRQLGGMPLKRVREREFSDSGLSIKQLATRIDDLRLLVVNTLSTAELPNMFPEPVFGEPITTLKFLIHLHGHLNYHMGQIDYARRFAAILK